ncbi:hypothetical protein AX16_001786 [Volvariella volvacea WC 439]|nr:hypothetical protein AX16_001786 [Volvariella volvacea WC 439]
MIPSLSTASLDLADVLDDAVSLIMDESLDFPSDSMTFTSSPNKMLPFNPAYKAPLFSLLGLGTQSPMFPNGIQMSNIYGYDDCHDFGPCVATIPTTGRMPCMLHEPICVLNWARNVTTLEAPGHVPWEAPQAFDPAVFVPQRPIIQPRKTPQEQRDQLPPWTPSPARLSKPFRDALVFEREITLTSGGTTRRWSLQVPATAMDPETVGYMLELRELNSFFKSTAESVEPDTNPRPERKALETPSLMVSNSHYALPVSLESSDYLSPNPHPSPPLLSNPIPLAIRRGKKLPPALAPTKQPKPLAYPGIPTPFRGSPSSLSPWCNGAGSQASAPSASLELKDMIASLRSHCRPMLSQETSPTEALSRTTCQNFKSGSSDEWAFAKDLLSGCDDYLFTSSYKEKGKKRESDALNEPTSLSPSESFTSTNSAESTCGDATDYQNMDSLAYSARPLSVYPAPITPPPSLPLPQRPALCSTPSKEIRGILKSSKSVRFANSPPSRRQTAPAMETPVPLRDGQSTENFIGAPSRKGARRNTLAHNSPPPCGIPSLGTTPSPTIKPLSFGSMITPPSSAASTPVTDVPNPPATNKNSRGTRRSDNARPKDRRVQNTIPKRPISTPVAATHTANPPTANLANQSQSAPPLRSRRAVVSAGKENLIPRFSIRSQITPTRRVTVAVPPQSDPAGLKSSAGINRKGRPPLPGGRNIASSSKGDAITEAASPNTQSSASPSISKSKMPVPLRNILTRFR